MPTLRLTTLIHAPAQRVFDLSRSISLHKRSMDRYDERAIAGKTSGLINEGEYVTWQAKHLGKTRRFTSRITHMRPPDFFRDEMTAGDFRSFHHEHHFQAIENGTVMMDILHFETPYGWLGKLLDRLYLESYLRKMIVQRNQLIKQYAESDAWKVLLE